VTWAGVNGRVATGTDRVIVQFEPHGQIAVFDQESLFFL
jgi:hypothetical protein